MKIRLLTRPPVGLIYDVRPGSVHAVVEVASGADGLPRGYWIEAAPRKKRILVLVSEAEVLEGADNGAPPPTP